MTQTKQTSRAAYMRQRRATLADTLPAVELDQVTADALSRLVERTGRTRADLIRHLIRCADQDRDPMD